MGIWTRSSGSGNFVVGTDCPSTVTRLWIRGVGGGGGGAGSYITGGFLYAGGGGGSGGYFEDLLTVTGGQSISYLVGSGGAGQLSGVGFSNGDNGVSTVFGAATGGGGGGGFLQLTSVAGGNAGNSTGATLNVTGSFGGTGYVREETEFDDPFTANGGSSPFGGGGLATTVTASSGAPGTGGGGHVGATTNPGNTGNSGLIIVIWFQ